VTRQRPAAAEEWTADQVRAWLATQGRPVGASTWSAYVTRRQAPRPVRHVSRTPLWSAADVRAWHAQR
jgi:hypothetical protein